MPYVGDLNIHAEPVEDEGRRLSAVPMGSWSEETVDWDLVP